MDALVAELLRPMDAGSSARRHEVIDRLVALLGRLLVARNVTWLQWEEERQLFTVWHGRSLGLAPHATGTIPADAAPLPIISSTKIGLLIERPHSKRQVDLSLRRLLGRSPVLLLPVADRHAALGVLALSFGRVPHDAEMALALAFARRAAAAASGQPDDSTAPPLGGRISRPPRTRGLHTATTVALSPREREVVCLLTKGLRNKEIAARLRISEKTVKFHVGRIFDKLDVDSRTEVVLRVAAEGLLVSPEQCASGDEGGTVDPR